MFKKISMYLSILVALSTIIVGMFKLDSRWCEADTIQKTNDKVVQVQKQLQFVDLRLEQKIIQDSLNSSVQSQWKIEDRYGLDITKKISENKDTNNVNDM